MAGSLQELEFGARSAPEILVLQIGLTIKAVLELGIQTHIPTIIPILIHDLLFLTVAPPTLLFVPQWVHGTPHMGGCRKYYPQY